MEDEIVEQGGHYYQKNASGGYDPAEIVEQDGNHYLKQSNGEYKPITLPSSPGVKPNADPLSTMEQFYHTLDPYTVGPVRAAIGAASEPGELDPIGRIARGGKAGFEQFLAGKMLPTTPKYSKLVSNAQEKIGIPPEIAKASGSVADPILSGITDWTSWVGPEVFAEGVRGASATAREVGTMAQKPWFKLGEHMTKGRLETEPALRVAENLSPIEQIFPKLSGGSQKAKDTLQTVRNSNKANPFVIPGSSEAAANAAKTLEEGKNAVLSAPQMQTLVDRIRAKPGDLTTTEIDDIIRNLDEATRNASGDPKLKPRLDYYANQARAGLNGELQKSAQGQILKDAKTKSEGFINAGKGRSKMGELMQGKSMNPMKWLTDPSVYHEAVGVARLPGYPMEWLEKLIKKNPKAAEVLIRSTPRYFQNDREETP